MKSHNVWAREHRSRRMIHHSSVVRCPRFKALCCAAALVTVGLAFAGPAAANISVRLDQNAIMDLRAPAGTVLIGDPAVVDISLINPRKIAILGRGYGSTNVIITDRMGKVIFQQVVEVSRTNSNRVSVYRGGSVSNFTCSPSCERTPSPGEDTSAYQPYATPYKDHLQSAQPAGSGGGGGGASAGPSQ